LVGGRFARAFGTFSASATSSEGAAQTDGDATTTASLDGDDAEATSEGFSSSEAGED
ncbi:hypothetical protein IQ229_15430, partial [Nostoc cf. edaphicum LEGE 07299]|nr:hypothetical protein [Nostoc cf. edaphicum LEGE 07299]